MRSRGPTCARDSCNLFLIRHLASLVSLPLINLNRNLPRAALLYCCSIPCHMPCHMPKPLCYANVDVRLVSHPPPTCNPSPCQHNLDPPPRNISPPLLLPSRRALTRQQQPHTHTLASHRSQPATYEPPPRQPSPRRAFRDTTPQQPTLHRLAPPCLHALN